MGGWFAVDPGPSGPMRLFCFHHAGAGALSFARWQNRFLSALPVEAPVRVVPVRLPGRESRLREPRITSATRLLDELEAALRAYCDEPYALYGHSLGALVAYSVADRLRSRGLRPPELLAVGACSPPHLGMPLLDGAELDDRALHGLLERTGGEMPQSSLGPVWSQTMLDILRDDLLLARGLRAAAGRTLDVPVLALAGQADHVAPVAQVAEWSAYTVGGFTLRSLPGDHFFVRDEPVVALLAERLGQIPADCLTSATAAPLG
ncbi:thioesterase II family protein [Streptacidiphilus anmyonensis]|uniref:thioesterase II family protein n=1 Tax=Streptacidiphilus anmyonensis TaxID=405782 RepID=UPI0005AA1753|nr:thioesterase domain-containing protein [Streptacidiphilus anmyonensis]